MIKLLGSKTDEFNITEVLTKYENIEKISFEKYIEPSKKFADIIIPNLGIVPTDEVEQQLINNAAIMMLVNEVDRQFKL